VLGFGGVQLRVMLGVNVFVENRVEDSPVLKVNPRVVYVPQTIPDRSVDQPPMLRVRFEDHSPASQLIAPALPLTDAL
jgi:hypothetical protein